MAKTAKGLVAYVEAQIGQMYWYGTFGKKPTIDYLNNRIKAYPYPKYPSYTPERVARFKKAIGDPKYKRVYDCVGLIKGYLWSSSPNSVPNKYDENQDKNANTYRALSNAKSIKTMPEVPGILVFKEGHVGVYVGNKKVVEAKGSDYGVVKTDFAKGNWNWWGYCPWITYEGVQATAATATSVKTSASNKDKDKENSSLKTGKDTVKTGKDTVVVTGYEVGTKVKFKADAKRYWDGDGPILPSSVKKATHTISQTRNGKGEIIKKGSPTLKTCVLLKDPNTWAAIELLDIVKK